MEPAAQLPGTWRINLKTAASSGIDPRGFCIDGDILGIGWQVDASAAATAEGYLKEAALRYPKAKGWRKAFNALQRMAEGDLCWTRDLDGTYYLGRIGGPWSYVAEPENIAADVVNVRPCVWTKVGPVDAVPGRVVSSFRPAATVQRILDDTVRLYSAHLFNQLVGQSYPLPRKPLDIFSLLGDDDCEDLVGLWMQLDGYVLLPSSCKLATVGYEWIMVHRSTGARGTAQVKSGNVDLEPARYSGFPGTVYLFTSRGRFLGSLPDNVRCISVSEMREFMSRNKALLPERVIRWLDLAQAPGSAAPAV